MFNKILLIALSFGSTVSFSQSRKGSFHLAKNSDKHELYVSILSNYSIVDLFNNSNFEVLQKEFQINLTKGIALSEEKILSMEESAIRQTGNANSISKLRNIYVIQIIEPSNERLYQLAEKLEQLEIVEYCSLISLNPIAPPTDIPPTTPDYEVNQTYIEANPGVDMRYAWDMNLTGQGINIRDVEYGFNKNHEELAERNAFLAQGMTISFDASVAYTEHGTAVFGIIFADKGNYGISGMAHGANEIILFPEWQQSGYNRIIAVSNALNNSTIGDVVIYEMQTGDLNDDYVPAEFDNVVWDLTNAATNSGIVIVAAAGNGDANLDLDHDEYMNRGNSGAIIVGAGNSSTSHNKLSFSTYGTRVNVQGWGTNVRASGYGDFSQIGSDFNQNYTSFSGTSSATPIVASCVIVLQSYYHSLNGNYMTSEEIRDLLIITGIAQGTGGHIGPLPNMQSAITKIQNDFLTASIEEANVSEFILFPNPTNDKLTILTKELSNSAQLEIENSISQIVYSSLAKTENIINTSDLKSGMYFVKITNNGNSIVKKFIKN